MASSDQGKAPGLSSEEASTLGQYRNQAVAGSQQAVQGMQNTVSSSGQSAKEAAKTWTGLAQETAQGIMAGLQEHTGMGGTPAQGTDHAEATKANTKAALQQGGTYVQTGAQSGYNMATQAAQGIYQNVTESMAMAKGGSAPASGQAESGGAAAPAADKPTTGSTGGAGASELPSMFKLHQPPPPNPDAGQPQPTQNLAKGVNDVTSQAADSVQSTGNQAASGLSSFVKFKDPQENEKLQS